MNSPKTKPLLNTGLIVLMAVLFVVSFQLNRNNYFASLGTVETSLAQQLEQQVDSLRKDIEQQEVELFSRFGNSNLPEVSAREPDLFWVFENRVVPACTTLLLETASTIEANEAFQKGLETQPKASALPWFKTAAKLEANTPADLYRKIGALFNMLELEPDIETVYCILALLNQTDPAVTDSQKLFFNNLLKDQVSDLENIEKRLKELQKTAEAINQRLTRKEGFYREAFNNQTLTIRENGLALLYKPGLFATAPIELSNTKTANLHTEIIPGHYAVISNTVITDAKSKIIKQYKTGNTIFSLMLLLGTLLSFGLFAASKRQRKLDAARTQFIATVSHELRTPLSLIRLHAETLTHGRISDDKVANYHQTILTEAERLTGIVNNVLDFSRIERDKLQLHLERTDLTTLLNQTADSFFNRLEQEKITLERKIADGAIANIDPIALSQIVFNLLDNAIKYSGTAKTIQIRLEVSKDWNILSIADQGIGIPNQLKPHIFDEFVRSNDREVSARRGSGIGLNVARRLAEMMNGTIEVTDNEPAGSIFTVRLKDDDETTGG